MMAAILARMTTGYWIDAPTEELVTEVFNPVIGMPVRALEALIPRGADAAELLRGCVRAWVEAGNPELADWCIVALGNAQDPAALPELLPLLKLAHERGQITLGFLAAEAIGRIGAPAMEPLIAAAREVPRCARLWHYYAAGRIRNDVTAAFLMDELEVNPRLGDVLVLALTEQGRRDAVPRFARVLKRLRRWQRAAVEIAVSVLVHGTDHLAPGTSDWRLRYRPPLLVPDLPPFWPCFAASFHSSRRGKGGPPLRTLEEIIALGPLPPDPRTCICGGAPAPMRTGLSLCDACAPDVARTQADYLLDNAIAFGSEDLFDVLDWIETPDSRDEELDWKEFQRSILALAGCRWLIEQGVETRSAGAATLLVEADSWEVSRRGAAICRA
jgi:hypothetical protein